LRKNVVGQMPACCRKRTCANWYLTLSYNIRMLNLVF